MTHTIDPRKLYPKAPFFLDYIDGAVASSGFFEHSLENLDPLLSARQSTPDIQTRAAVCDALHRYNSNLNASAESMSNIHRLRASSTLCVIGGQQAGLLGGPQFVLYKIASIIRTASWLSHKLETAVVPVFWLATEDHDFAEINHIRWLDESSAVRTLTFNWDEEGRPIEDLPFSPRIQSILDEAMQKIPFNRVSDAALFAPEDGDDYSSWHARIWSRLFAKHGLVVVEPRVVRPLAKSFFERALADRGAIQDCLEDSAVRLGNRGYPVPLDPASSGTLFDISKGSPRHRIEQAPGAPTSEQLNLSPEECSTDAALRPLLADSLLPTAANILGPSELAYHAMLRPLYQHWHVPQPLAIPRQGATLLSPVELELLHKLNLTIDDALASSFNPASIIKALASSDLSNAFDDARNRLEQALHPLRDYISSLDPGLETRWRQTADQAQHQIDKLEDRAIRAELARRGVPAKQLRSLKSRLQPMEQPQERILSAFSLVARFGVEWLEELIAYGEPTRFKHQLIVTKEAHE